MRRRLPFLLATVAAIAAAWALLVWSTGGFTFALGSVRVASSNGWRPLVMAVLLAALLAWLEGPRGAWQVARRLGSPSLGVALLSLTLLFLGVRFGSWTASGPDPFAYLSQAQLWRAAQLEVPLPLAAAAPWPDAPATFTP